MSKYFETIKCDDEEMYNLEYHHKRILATIGLNINLYDYIYPPSSELLRCKVIYDDNGIENVSFYYYEKKIIRTFKIIQDDKIDYKFKYLDRSEIDFFTNSKGECDEIIIFKNGLLTDTSIANIAILLEDNKWYTPKTPLLYGTTRARYIECKKIIPLDIDMDIFKKAKKIALMNAMIDFDILPFYSFSL